MDIMDFKNEFFGTILAAIALIVCVTIFEHTLENPSVSSFDVEDIKITDENIPFLYDVEIDHVRKEKDKEDVYEISYTNAEVADESLSDTMICAIIKNQNSSLSEELSEKEFEQKIGAGNNTLSGDVYYLSLTMKYNDVKSLRLKLMRYEILGENDFSEEEIKQIMHDFVGFENEHIEDDPEGIEKQIAYKDFCQKYAPNTHECYILVYNW